MVAQKLEHQVVLNLRMLHLPSHSTLHSYFHRDRNDVLYISEYRKNRFGTDAVVNSFVKSSGEITLEPSRVVRKGTLVEGYPKERLQRQARHLERHAFIAALYDKVPVDLAVRQHVLQNMRQTAQRACEDLDHGSLH